VVRYVAGGGRRRPCGPTDIYRHVTLVMWWITVRGCLCTRRLPVAARVSHPSLPSLSLFIIIINIILFCCRIKHENKSNTHTHTKMMEMGLMGVCLSVPYTFPFFSLFLSFAVLHGPALGVCFCAWFLLFLVASFRQVLYIAQRRRLGVSFSVVCVCLWPALHSS